MADIILNVGDLAIISWVPLIMAFCSNGERAQILIQEGIYLLSNV